MNCKHFLLLSSFLQIIYCQKYCVDQKKFPEDGQIFYLKSKRTDAEAWYSADFSSNIVKTMYRDECKSSRSRGSSSIPLDSVAGVVQWDYNTLEKLPRSGNLYRWRWHDCGAGKVTMEYLDHIGYSGYFGENTGGNDYEYDEDYDYGHEHYLHVDNQAECLYVDVQYGNPCNAQKQSLSNITNGIGLWNEVEIYVPQVCFSFKPVDSHCNCGDTTVTKEYLHEVGISTTKGTQQGVTDTEKFEIQSAVKASASGSLFSLVDVGLEYSLGTNYGQEIARSFLHTTSSTWHEKKTRKFIVDIPGKTCSTLYQAVAQYGDYNVEGTKTLTKERKAGRFCQK